MKPITQVRNVATLMLMLVAISTSVIADDLVFTEEETRFMDDGHDLTFTEEEVAEWNRIDNLEGYDDLDPLSRCYYYGICGENMTRDDLITVLGEDISLEELKQMLGPRPSDALPHWVNTKGACARLRKLVNNYKTRLYDGLRRQVGNIMTKDEVCVLGVHKIINHQLTK